MNNEQFEIENCLYPVWAGNADGNGFVIRDLFFTAGHIVNKSKSFTIYIENENIQLCKEHAIFMSCDSINDSGNYFDFAIYRLPKKYNNLTIDSSIPQKGDSLKSISFKRYETRDTSNSIAVGIFSSSLETHYSLHKSQAIVDSYTGNFIICKMSEKLEEGRSGSPLFKDDKVIGLLHGGIDGSVCVFQSMHSIMNRCNFSNKILF
jgi:hypothetical protein